MTTALSLGIATLYITFVLYGFYTFFGMDFRSSTNAIILSLIGIISIIVGIFLGRSLGGIGSGIMLGGVFILIAGAGSIFFTNINKYLKIVILGIGLIVMIFFGYKLIESKKDDSLVKQT